MKVSGNNNSGIFTFLLESLFFYLTVLLSMVGEKSSVFIGNYDAPLDSLENKMVNTYEPTRTKRDQRDLCVI